MFSITLTTRGRMRMEQRGVLLNTRHFRALQGSREVVFIDMRERRRLSDRQKLQRQGRDRFCGLYASTDERGAVIAVGHRNRRLARGAR